MNTEPKNTSVYTPQGKAELFFQVVNCNHIMDNYREDVEKTGNARIHDVKFTDIAKLLSGNVCTFIVPKSKEKVCAISFYKGKYYVTYLFLKKRPDCEQLFAVIVSCFISNNPEIKRHYEDYLISVAKLYPKGG